ARRLTGARPLDPGTSPAQSARQHPGRLRLEAGGPGRTDPVRPGPRRVDELGRRGIAHAPVHRGQGRGTVGIVGSLRRPVRTARSQTRSHCAARIGSDPIEPPCPRPLSRTTRIAMRHRGSAPRVGRLGVFFVRIAALGSGLVIVALPADDAQAKVETWRQEGPAAFAKCHREGVVVSDNGRVRLGQAVTAVGSLRAARVWDLAGTREGALLVATGDAGQVFRRGPKPDVAWNIALDSHDSQALALVVCPDGTIFAGTGPTGQVVNLSDPKHPASRPDPKVQYIWDLAADGHGNLFAATGPNGQLWKRSRDGRWSLLYDSKATHLLCVALG